MNGIRVCPLATEIQEISYDGFQSDLHAIRVSRLRELNLDIQPMELPMKYARQAVAAAVLGFTLAGCTGTAIKSPQYDSSQYTVLGHSEASATGVMLFGIIPIGQNSRFVRAQTTAIQAKGGDALINTQIQEKWFWAWVLSGYTTKISGDVVKLKAAQ